MINLIIQFSIEKGCVLFFIGDEIYHLSLGSEVYKEIEVYTREIYTYLLLN